MSEITNIISINVDLITNHEDPEGKCDDWNGKLATIFSDNGWQATVVAEPRVSVLNDQDRPIGYHAITIAYSPQKKKWVAADLSAPQIKNIDEVFVYVADTLQKLADKVKETYGGKWSGLQDQKLLLEDAQRRREILEYRKKLKQIE
jgi:hypothetical protein